MSVVVLDASPVVSLSLATPGTILLDKFPADLLTLRVAAFEAILPNKKLPNKTTIF
ncbi:hypothetical protein IB655_01870 [Francisella noatunensis]|uniref:Uncharacterized protein n=1 Tax=Francisella noatunensis TaxID=657445 RepID=A0A9Q2QH92_9GAMM|nr:hypothetical protein [Francisella noatunensis]MBK2028131.1 hypothetical protein [Francisella noatunensis]MBK2033730.1 hypothetical protein [Francisella noatunensis]MBK2048138.1 hypothetical protein [Francisella noatunensis]MBK2049588.1 hypothetical protein [Francisella noatunensis]MBK2051174.1 hypothetical protein [Francisella noatunensis]